MATYIQLCKHDVQIKLHYFLLVLLRDSNYDSLPTNIKSTIPVVVLNRS
jgi:hypothetical protein